MYKHIFFLFFLVFCFSCKNDPNSLTDTKSFVDETSDTLQKNVTDTIPTMSNIVTKPTEYQPSKREGEEREDSIKIADKQIMQSSFTNLGCCSNTDKRKEDCCCEEVVKKYLIMMEKGELTNLSEDVIFNLCKEIPKWRMKIEEAEEGEPLG